jgi:hypothetical protein
MVLCQITYKLHPNSGLRGGLIWGANMEPAYSCIFNTNIFQAVTLHSLTGKAQEECAIFIAVPTV